MLRIIFNIKGPTSLLQLRHDTNILSLEERRKEIWKQLFFKSFAHCIDHNFHVPFKPERKKYFVKPDGVHFIDLLLNQNSTFTPFGHVPLVIFGMVFSLLSFRAV